MGTIIRYQLSKTEKRIYSFSCTECMCDTCHRPEGQEKLTHLEGNYLCDECGREANYYDDSFTACTEIDAYPYPGFFVYNEHGVCISGEVKLVDYERDGIRLHGTLARTSNGWGFHTSYSSRFTHTGAGGASSPLGIEQDYPTEDDAAIECVKKLMRYCDYEMSSKHNHIPPTVIAKFNSAKKFLERQLGKFDRPELIKPGTQLTLF